MSGELAGLPRVTIQRGDWHRPAPGFEFEVDRPVTVYLAVDRRGSPKLPETWQQTDLSLAWGRNFQDCIYSRTFPAGTISIPSNSTEHTSGAFGMPHMAFIESHSLPVAKITAEGNATVTTPAKVPQAAGQDPSPVRFTLEVDRKGNGHWTELDAVDVPNAGYVTHYLPDGLEAVWLRFKTSRDCVATALLHQTSNDDVDGTTPEHRSLFDGLADVNDETALGSLVYAAKRNRNLRVITGDNRYFEFTKSGFTFEADRPDPQLKELLHVEPEFTVDEASVVLKYTGQNLRLPKGDPAFDKPFASGWPRASREVESERQLANIHGTFYEVPLITNGAPPAWNLMRPVSSHSKQIGVASGERYASETIHAWVNAGVFTGISERRTNPSGLRSLNKSPEPLFDTIGLVG